MNGTNRQPRVPAWLRALLRDPWAPLHKEVERERQRVAYATMPRR